MGCFVILEPLRPLDTSPINRGGIFLDVLDKRDASLSRFSVLKTDRTDELCVHTVFGIAIQVVRPYR